MTVFIAIVLFVIYVFSMRFVSRTIEKLGEKKSVNTYRIKYISKTLNISLTGFLLLSCFFCSVFNIRNCQFFCHRYLR